MKREETRAFQVGNLTLGGNNHVIIQSMTNTKTKNINEIIFYGSFDNEALTGILGIKSNGKHISLFFIKPEYHRHGLGKKLFHYASILPLKQRLILLLMLFLSTRVWDLLS